jgi:hypothetical protein
MLAAAAIGDPEPAQDERCERMLGYSYPFLSILWTMFVFFAFVIWVYLLVIVLGDNFRRRDHNGWAKAGWTLFVIFLPLIGVLVYMIAKPPGDSALYA